MDLDWKILIPVNLSWNLVMQDLGNFLLIILLLPHLKKFQIPVSEMSSFALSLTGWTRVILDDYNEWLSNISNEDYRSIVAVPDQRVLPIEMHHGRRSYYSKFNGSNSLINGLSEILIINEC